MYCKKCGAQLKEGQKFCKVCGTPVSSARPGGTNTAGQNSIKAAGYRAQGTSVQGGEGSHLSSAAIISVICVALLIVVAAIYFISSGSSGVEKGTAFYNEDGLLLSYSGGYQTDSDNQLQIHVKNETGKTITDITPVNASINGTNIALSSLLEDENRRLCYSLHNDETGTCLVYIFHEDMTALGLNPYEDLKFKVSFVISYNNDGVKSTEETGSYTFTIKK